MTRRGGPSAKYVAIVVVFFLCLYGFYCFHNVYTRLKNAEEKTTRLGQQHDSVSAQLQVVYEHKNRLEKSLQQEKTDHQRTKDELKQQQAEFEAKAQNEKNELMGRIDSINQENKMLQMKVDDQELDNTKLKEEVSNLQHDSERRDTQHNEEYLQFKQEKEFEIGHLKDELSNTARKRQELEYQLEAALKGQQLNQNQMQHQMQPVGQQQQQHPQYGQQNNYAGQPQANLLNQGQVRYQGQQMLQGQQAAVPNHLQQQQQQHPNVMQFNQNQQQFAGVPVGGGLDSVHNLQGAQNQPNAPIHEDSMQINKPDEKKSYFEPKVQEDNLEHKLAAEAKHQEDSLNDGGKVVQEQVIPPKLQENNHEGVENQYGKNPALEGGDINNVENRYEKKLNEDADGNQNYRYQEDNEDDSKELNRYKENPDNVVLEPHQIANAGPEEQKQIQPHGFEPRVLDQGGMNAENPIKAPNGFDMNHPNDPFRRVDANNLAPQMDSNVRQIPHGGLKYDNDKALEEGVNFNNNPAVLDVNQDKAAEVDDFNAEHNVQFPIDGEQKEQAVDRPPLIGQGLRGGLPQHGNGPMMNPDRHHQEVAPDGLGQQ